jgi:hypothetical protein
MKNQLKEINREIEDFKTKQITIVPGFYFNQYETIEKIYFYYNSKYQTGEVDSDGDKKYFYNITKNPCKVFSKAIDFDTKNIRLLTTGGGDPIKTWFMERDLKYWMRDKQFGKILNRLFRELPIFGSAVLKIIDGKPYFVDLRNFVVQQSQDTLRGMNYIIEVHNFTPVQFRKVAKKMGWGEDKVNETLTKYYEMKDTSHIRVYERYGEVEDEGDYSYRRVFIADVGVDEYDQRGNLQTEKQGVMLSSEEWDGNPYWEFHAEKMPGRWLGIGVVESLFEPQVSENERVNLQSKTAYWSSLRLFFSRDANMAGNLATEKRNGDVIIGEDPITQIDMSDRNLSFFNDLHERWMKNRDELTFSYDVVQGERLPAGTPLGSAQIATTQTLSYFEQIQEDIALDLKELLYKVIIPSFEKESTSEHTLRIIGADLDNYIELVKNDLVLKEVIRLAVNGKFPNNADKQTIEIAVEENIKKDKELQLTVPRGYYDDVEYDVDIDITGESTDTRVKYATIFALLQAVTADPTLTSDPSKRKMLFALAEQGGVNPYELFDVQKKEMNEMMPQNIRAGGGVSAPAVSQPLQGGATTTI